MHLNRFKDADAGRIKRHLFVLISVESSFDTFLPLWFIPRVHICRIFCYQLLL